MNYALLIFFAAGFGGGGTTVYFPVAESCVKVRDVMNRQPQVAIASCIETATGRIIPEKHEPRR